MSSEKVIRELKTMGDPAAVEGMKRFGIVTDTPLGTSVPTLRSYARRLGRTIL